MSLVGNFEIEIQDLGDTSGSAYLMWVRTQGGTDGDVRSNVKLRHKSEANKAPAPLIVRGVGPSLGLSASDPSVAGFGRGGSGLYYNQANDDWITGATYSIISGEGYALSNSAESAFSQSVYEGYQQFNVNEQDTQYPAGARRARLDVIRPTGSGFWLSSTTKNANSGAWLSYKVSGEAEKNVFAYSFEIIAEISGTGAQKALTGQDYKASELLYLTGVNHSGVCHDVSLLLSATGEDCVYDPNAIEKLTEKPLQFCVPNSIQDDATLSGYIKTGMSNVNALIREIGQKTKETDKSNIENKKYDFSYSTYEGVIAYNHPYSGDYISLYPYAYDFTGEYLSAYDTYPPYPAETITFHYPSDYSGVDSLIAAINAALSGSGQYLWNKEATEDLCSNDNSLIGFFESGGLLKASKSGNDHIFFQSLRAGAVGKYQFSFFAAARPSGIEASNKTKLLLPSNVYLEGSVNESSWTQLNSMVPKWSDCSVETHSKMYVPIDDGRIPFITGNVSGISVPPPDQEEEVVPTGFIPKTVFFSGKASGITKCEDPLSIDVEFYRVPTPFACKKTGREVEDGDENLPYIIDTGILKTGVSGQINVQALVYKTGAKFSTTGDYNFYRLRFENLVANQQGELCDVLNILHVPRVTFFGVKSGSIGLSGETCILGSDYSGQVLGYTTGRLTGTISGQAGVSGTLELNRYRVTGTPESPVVFQYSQGQPVGAFTGLVTASQTGVSYYSDVVEGYFYNSGSDCVYFEAPVSGVISGSGSMTGGAYNILNDSFVAGLSENYQEVSGYEFGSFTGISPNFSYLATDMPSYYPYSGNATGTVGTGDAGYLDVSRLISTIPTGTVYTLSLSGTREATANVAYNAPASGDTIVIDNVPFIFSTETGGLYYSSASGLVQQINDNASTNATGAVSGAYVFLRSTTLGEAGNEISIEYSGGAGKPSGPSYFTGGRDIHYELSASESFTGQLNSGIYAVQYLQTSGSGYLTGRIKQLDFIRHFSGVWDLATGAISFRESGKYSFGKYSNSGFETLGYYSGRPDYIPLSISYNNYPYVGTVDFARLTITGYDSGTGLSVNISGRAL